MTRVDGSTRIFVVWGPTAEWGNGTGPIGYFENLESAEFFIEGEERELRDMADEALLSWPYEDAEFVPVEATLGELVPDYKEYGFSDVEDVLDYLNVR